MEVKKGYKQTELGVIPEDWDVCEFQDVMTGFSSGQTPYREIKKYYKGEIPWITSGELNYNIIIDTFEKITAEAVLKTNLKILPKDTFLFAITGLEAAGTRGSCGITGIEATTNQSCMALYPINGKLTTEFLYHYYVKNGDLLAFKYCQGTKQQSYTAALAKKLPIVLPSSIKEQTAIATALSDMDALIAQTEKLIEKKKAMKQGMMQELLKPKKGWVTKTVKEIVKTPVTDGPHETPEFVSNGIPFLSVNNIIDNRIDYSDLRFITIEDDLRFSRKCKPQKNDILLGKAASVGKVALVNSDWDFNIWSPLALIRVKSEYSFLYTYYYFQTIDIKNQIDGLTNSSSQGNIGMRDIEKLIFSFPEKETERIDIGLFLSDLDSAIISKEKLLQKLKLQKQGMMQELLTGRIRLL